MKLFAAFFSVVCLCATAMAADDWCFAHVKSAGNVVKIDPQWDEYDYGYVVSIDFIGPAKKFVWINYELSQQSVAQSFESTYVFVDDGVAIAEVDKAYLQNNGFVVNEEVTVKLQPGTGYELGSDTSGNVVKFVLGANDWEDAPTMPMKNLTCDAKDCTTCAVFTDTSIDSLNNVQPEIFDVFEYSTDGTFLRDQYVSYSKVGELGGSSWELCGSFQVGDDTAIVTTLAFFAEAYPNALYRCIE